MKPEFVTFREGLTLYRVQGDSRIKIVEMDFHSEDWPWYVFIVRFIEEAHYPFLENYLKGVEDAIFENNHGEQVCDSGLFLSAHKKDNEIYVKVRDCRS